jgi:23S rRNA (cytosine1962-C5)-methyltransferase
LWLTSRSLERFHQTHRTMSASLPVLTLKPRRALPFFSRHPWVFAGAIATIPEGLPPGAEVELHSHEKGFIARGMYNPDSQIRVRLYSWDEAVPLDDNFWRKRVDDAVALRHRLFAGTPEERACRLIFSEGDGLSGLTVDRYDDWLLVQWTSRALQLREAVILDHLEKLLQPRGIWRRTEKGIGEEEALTLSDGLLKGAEPPRPLFIQDGPIRIGIDVVQGHKTGYYLDQRANRRRVARYCGRGRVLDAFSYTGGFGLAAVAIGGAAHVTAVDSSGPALEVARANAELNGIGERFDFVHAEVAPFLETCVAESRKFDVVVLDPPKMARTRSGLDRALKGYLRLNRLAIACLEPGGILASCSCSGLVDRESFLDVLARAAVEAKRSLQILEVGGQAEDHPVSAHCREGAYLKCVVARML